MKCSGYSKEHSLKRLLVKVDSTAKIRSFWCWILVHIGSIRKDQRTCHSRARNVVTKQISLSPSLPFSSRHVSSCLYVSLPIHGSFCVQLVLDQITSLKVLFHHVCRMKYGNERALKWGDKPQAMKGEKGSGKKVRDPETGGGSRGSHISHLLLHPSFLPSSAHPSILLHNKECLILQPSRRHSWFKYFSPLCCPRKNRRSNNISSRILTACYSSCFRFKTKVVERTFFTTLFKHSALLFFHSHLNMTSDSWTWVRGERKIDR